jgi:hypothetical protein
LFRFQRAAAREFRTRATARAAVAFLPARERATHERTHVSAMKQNATSGGNSNALGVVSVKFLEVRMRRARILAVGLIALVAIAAAPASTGTGQRGTCGIALSSDTKFQQFDRVQSVGAAKICAIYLNTLDTRLTP